MNQESSQKVKKLNIPPSNICVEEQLGDVWLTPFNHNNSTQEGRLLSLRSLYFILPKLQNELQAPQN